MIITQTPLRISFLGGGSDLPAFYEGDEGHNDRDVQTYAAK